MASTHELAVDVIASIPGYVDEFSRVFCTRDVTVERITESIAAFEENAADAELPLRPVAGG
jgi:cytochrome c peroxidase